MPEQRNQDFADKQSEPTVQKNCLFTNKINIHETSGESFNLSQPRFLHRLNISPNKVVVAESGLLKLYLAKF